MSPCAAAGVAWLFVRLGGEWRPKAALRRAESGWNKEAHQQGVSDVQTCNAHVQTRRRVCTAAGEQQASCSRHSSRGMALDFARPTHEKTKIRQ
jgi:hypothetical protein